MVAASDSASFSAIAPCSEERSSVMMNSRGRR
jgi:hypothetical protein